MSSLQVDPPGNRFDGDPAYATIVSDPDGFAIRLMAESNGT
jgi:hypothetical protein